MQGVFILIKRVYYLYPEFFTAGKSEDRLPRGFLLEWHSVKAPYPGLCDQSSHWTTCWTPTCFMTNLYACDKYWEKVTEPLSPTLKAFMSPAMRQEGAESTQPFRFILSKLRSASFYELPIQIILDELPPSHFVHITAPHPPQEEGGGRKARNTRAPHTAPRRRRAGSEVTRHRVISVMAVLPAVFYSTI